MTETIYKIINNAGLFSKGGQYPNFGKLGKVWKRKQDLSSHLGQTRKYPESYEIVEYQIVEIARHSIKDWQNAIVERREEREAQADKRHQEYTKEQRRIQYERLRDEFGS